MMLLAMAGVLVFAGCSDDDVPAPTASFTFEVDGLTVTFTSTTTDATGYSWNFGDGNSSTEQNPTHTYAEAGDYDVVLTVSNETGDATAEGTVEIADQTAEMLAGNWVMAPEAAALAVGPGIADGSWWSSSADDVTTRACYFDDVYTFAADGTFSIAMGDETWLEAWQEGVDADGCGTPVAPFVSGSHTFTATSESITVNGTGAFIGLPKVTNDGELSADPPAAQPSSVTYTIHESDFESATKSMTIYVNYADGAYWTFKLVSQ